MAAFRSRYRRGGRWWTTGTTTFAAAIVALVFVMAAGAGKPPPPQPLGPFQVPTGPIGVASGFADNDGGTTQPNNSSDYNPTANPDPNAATQPTVDWNSLATNPTYTISTPPVDPYGEAGGTSTSGWQWVALNDAAAVTSDTGFAGGTKQDNDCASVIGSKAPNKDDLKRAYISFQTVGTGTSAHTYLNLAWARIPQNTTSASAHVGFEFNQDSTNACGAGSDGLVHRKLGDMLLVYDFTGGSSAPPTISLSRWVTSGTCQVGSDAPPCWGTFNQLGPTVAEANVDTGLNHICLASTAGSCGPGESDHNLTTAGTKYEVPFQTSDNLAAATETLGASEFGEAGIDLTNAGVFTAGTCESFGKVYAVSRSSGDSNTAAMEDLVGPGNIHLSNCSSSATTDQQSSPDNVAADFTDLANNAQITTGTWVRDNATASEVAPSGWTGHFDFYLCSNSSTTLTGCDSTGTNNPASTTVTQVGSDVGVSDGSATGTSATDHLAAAGSYCWAAVFTGDSPADLPGAIATTTECFSVTSPTSIATNPFFYPQDRAVISASSGGTVAGSVTFSLYDTSTHCNAKGVTGRLFGPDAHTSLTGTGTPSTITVDSSNTNYRVSATTTGSLYWLVSFSSTNNNQTGSSSTCVEYNAATINADGTVTFP